MIDPIVKHYYNLFTNGNKKDKLDILRDYLKMTLEMRREISTNDCNKSLYFVASITGMVVDNQNKGYALLDVQVYNKADAKIPFQVFGDIGIIDNGVLHTWFSYDKVSFFDYTDKCKLNTMLLTDVDTYITDKAFDFAKKVCKDMVLWNDILTTTPNGAYTCDSFVRLCAENRDAVAEYDELELKQHEGTTDISFAEVVDALGLDVDAVNSTKETEQAKAIDLGEVIEAEYTEVSVSI